MEQLGTEGWRSISFASRFLNAAEKKYSTNELLEMLPVVWGTEYFKNYILGRYFTVITNHKALISLPNGTNKKNKTLFSRLTRWLDKLIPYDFVIEHKPGAKIGIADYLSRHPSEPPKPISQYDNLITASIRKSLGFTNNLKTLGERNHQANKRTGSKQSRQLSSNQNLAQKTCLQSTTVEGAKSSVKTPTNRKRAICILPTSTKSKGHSVCSMDLSFGRRLNQPKLKNLNKMDDNSTCSFPVIKITSQTNSQTNSPNRLHSQTNSPLRLDENLLSSDEITVINPEIVAITKNTRDSKINTVLSNPSKFPGELFPTVNPNQQTMSVIPRDCKVIKKSQALPELFKLEFVASNIPADVNLLRGKEALEKKINLIRLAAEATYCQQCTDAGKNLKTLLPRGDVGLIPEPREPNECI